MTKDEVVKAMEQLADRLETWLNNNTKVKRKLCAILTGPLPPNEVDDTLRWLGQNASNMLEPFRTQYRELISCAQSIDDLTDPAKIMSTIAVKAASNLFGEFLYRGNVLVATLRDNTEAPHDTASPETLRCADTIYR